MSLLGSGWRLVRLRVGESLLVCRTENRDLRLGALFGCLSG